MTDFNIDEIIAPRTKDKAQERSLLFSETNLKQLCKRFVVNIDGFSMLRIQLNLSQNQSFYNNSRKIILYLQRQKFRNK